MRYQATPAIVDASKIEEVKKPLPSGHVGLTLENDGWHLATPEQVAMFKPSVGDYVVMGEDGNVYLYPKALFKQKYYPVK